MSLDKRKKEAELAKVLAARLDLEVRVEEKLEEIERLKEHIKIQQQKEDSLKLEIKQM